MTEKEANEKKVVDESGKKKVDDVPKTSGKKKVDDVPITIVLKLDLHCDGCAKKIKKSIRHLEGVETVKADYMSNKLTITGKVDIVYIKERVEYKTKKKVEILSPKPKKDEGDEKKVDDKKDDKQASNDQKPKEAQSTTAVLKIPLHCHGCIHKIKRIISKIDGVKSVKAENDKNLVTVKGTMNTKELIPYLKEKLKRNVDLVPPPKKEESKDDEKKDEKKVEEGGDKKQKEGDNDGDDKKKNDVGKPTENSTEGGEKKKIDEVITATSGGDEKKSADEAQTVGGDGGEMIGGDGGERSKNVEVVNKPEYHRHNPYVYTMPVYNQSYHNQDYGVSVSSSMHGYANEGYVNHGYAMEYLRGPPLPPSPMSLHSPRASETDIFSVENPNACSVM